MRQLTMAFTLAGAMTAAALATDSTPIRAQDPPPEAEASVIAETLAVGPLMELPGQALLQLRVTLAPGAVVPNHVHPGNLVFSVESGEITYTAVEGSVPVSWAGAATPTAETTLNPGDEVVLEAGDWLFEQRGTLHEVRNTGDTPAVLLISALVAADEPFLQLVDTGATPTP